MTFRSLSPLVVALMLAACVSRDGSPPGEPPVSSIPVVFPDEARFANGDTNFLVESSIPGEADTPDKLVRAMLERGDEVKNQNLTAPFSPATLQGSSQREGARPLLAYYRGARIEGTAFILSFNEEAFRYLNNTSAIQQVVKGAIEETVRRNFSSIKEVKYEVDGEIVEDWDA